MILASASFASNYICTPGDTSVVSPLRYFYLFFSMIGGMIVFAKFPELLSYAGMALIVAAGLYLLHRERLRAKGAVITPTASSCE